jgi:VIT1/CCC1 family predicted Fe2+/Mn2+ transporter
MGQLSVLFIHDEVAMTLTITISTIVIIALLNIIVGMIIGISLTRPHL